MCQARWLWSRGYRACVSVYLCILGHIWVKFRIFLLQLSPWIKDSLLAFPFILQGIFYVYGRFSTPDFLSIFGEVFPHTSATILHFRGSTILWVLTSFFLSCVGFIHHHRPQGPTLFRRVRWDFTCVQCCVCTDTGPPV